MKIPEAIGPLHETDPHASRAFAARQGYIAWRMGDLPAVYQALLPVSYHAATLWNAERSIRQQYEQDQKLAASPWQKLGPSCFALLDSSGMTPTEMLEFSISAEVPQGMTDRPKPGRADEVGEALDARDRVHQDARHSDAIQQLTPDAASFDPNESMKVIKAMDKGGFHAPPSL